jgi:hypothetical protein
VFEKLLSLLLHAKGGAVASVFVLGTTGALVTATVDAGVTTITITQPSTTTAGSETNGSTTNTTVTDTILALFNRTSAEEDPTATATGNGCSDAAHVRNKAKDAVKSESKTQRAEARGLGKDAQKSDAARELVREADTAIKDIRQAAVKAIHATFDCDKEDDEDEDVDDEDEGDTSTTTTTGPTVAFSSDDAMAIAELAILAMKEEVTDLKEALEALEDAEAESETTSDEKQNGKSDNAKNENKGNGKDKGNGKGRD